MQVAQVVQHSDPKDVEAALQRFAELNEEADLTDFVTHSNASKALLLMRMVFEYPEQAEPGWGYVPYGWGAQRLDFGFPVGWRDRLPYLKADYVGYSGAPYAGISEYRYGLVHLPYRDLAPLIERTR